MMSKQDEHRQLVSVARLAYKKLCTPDVKDYIYAELLQQELSEEVLRLSRVLLFNLKPEPKDEKRLRFVLSLVRK